MDYNTLLEDPVKTSKELFDGLTGLGVSGVQLPAESEIAAWIELDRRPAPTHSGNLTASQHALLAAIEDRSILDTQARDV